MKQKFPFSRLMVSAALLSLITFAGCMPEAKTIPDPEITKLRDEARASREEMAVLQEQIDELRQQVSSIREGLGTLRKQSAGIQRPAGTAVIPEPEIAPDNETLVETGSEEWKKGEFSSAFKTLLPAAQNGHPIAQHRLGVMYVFGQGVPRDLAEAAKWFQLAAEQGQGESQFSLGKRYLEGQGVEQNTAQALHWLTLAANQGVEHAASALSDMYANGRGVPKDPVEAYKWLLISNGATEWDQKLPTSPESLAANMTPAQIEEAKRLAQAFKPSRTGLADF